jgi:hypothetical protein
MHRYLMTFVINKFLAFQSFDFERHLMNVFLETRRAH